MSSCGSKHRADMTSIVACGLLILALFAGAGRGQTQNTTDDDKNKIDQNMTSTANMAATTLNTTTTTTTEKITAAAAATTTTTAADTNKSSQTISSATTTTATTTTSMTINATDSGIAKSTAKTQTSSTTTSSTTTSASTSMSSSSSTKPASTSEAVEPLSTSEAVVPPVPTTKKPRDDSLVIGVVVAVGGVILLALVVIIILIICKIRRNESEVRRTTHMNGARGIVNMAMKPFHDDNIVKPSQPVPANRIRVADFLSYVRSHQSSMVKYKQEFESLPGPNVKSRKTALDNDNKNRYINILPYDETRVDLALSSENGPNYINASFIDGYKKEKLYIATQGPMEKTIQDFWLMVWLHRADRIVMVTKLVENFRPKCDLYWPKEADKPETYGDITVTMTRESTANSDFIVREFIVHKSEEPERVVRHFHYTTWPDQGVPSTCTALIKFHKAIFKSPEATSDEPESPVVIHCSAGVGRSGTLIALDKLLCEAADTQSIDVLQCIDGLRQQRMYMVQTLGQYIFLHHVMLESLLLGDVTYPAVANFADVFQRLRQPKRPSKHSMIEQQFEVLEALKPKRDGLCTVAQTGDNSTRNRASASLPMDHSLVYLRPVEEDDNTYINAVSVKGNHSDHAMYIATQMPMPSTASDFWRLVKDNSCVAIVMLNSMESTDNSEQYWPQDGHSIVVGKFTVTNNGSEKYSDSIIITNLSVSYQGRLKNGYDRSSSVDQRTSSSTNDSEDDDDYDDEKETAMVDASGAAQLYANVTPLTPTNNTSFTVRHMRVVDWPPERPFPSDKKTLLALHSQLMECQQSEGNDRFLVHCLHGVERTGLFCAMMNMLDQLTTDKEVDVYDAVKRVRQARPEFIHDIEQYTYIYELAAYYLSSSRQDDDGPLYANSSLM